MNKFMRPDENAAVSEIERSSSTDRLLKKGAASVIGAGVTAAGANIMPFLNQYIPSDLAIRGISKIAPSVGNFLKRGQSMGLNVEEGLKFVKDSFMGNQDNSSSQATPKEKLNIIQQYSPELHEFIEKEIQSGRSPLEAGALASLDRKGKDFKKIIRKIEEDHKSPFSSILETVYGGKQAARPERQAELPEQANQQAPGKGEEALMAILQKIKKSRGGQ